MPYISKNFKNYKPGDSLVSKIKAFAEKYVFDLFENPRLTVIDSNTAWYNFSYSYVSVGVNECVLCGNKITVKGNFWAYASPVEDFDYYNSIKPGRFEFIMSVNSKEIDEFRRLMIDPPMYPSVYGSGHSMIGELREEKNRI